MTTTWTLRRVGVLAAAALLATAIGAQPLYAAAGDNPTTGDKKTEHKTTAKKTKPKPTTEQGTTGSSQMQGYRPDVTPGSGY
jgi:hypothetical protein